MTLRERRARPAASDRWVHGDMGPSSSSTGDYLCMHMQYDGLCGVPQKEIPAAAAEEKGGGSGSFQLLSLPVLQASGACSVEP